MKRTVMNERSEKNNEKKMRKKCAKSAQKVRKKKPYQSIASSKGIRLKEELPEGTVGKRLTIFRFH
jgi:hypothetical protein